MAADGERQSETYGRGNSTLRGALKLLPTPAAGLHNYEESVESFTARQEKLKQKGINGNGAGMPLPIALKLLPTPTSASYQQGGTAAEETEIKRILGVLPSTGESTDRPSSDGSASTGLHLNPSFVEWMLGLPRRWSDPSCLLSATEFKSIWELQRANTSSSSSGSA